MAQIKAPLVASILLLGTIPAYAGSATQELTFNLRTVTALSLSGDLAFDMDDLVAGDGIYSIDNITLNYDNGESDTPTAGGVRTVMCTVSVDNGITYANADSDSGGSLQTITLTSNSENENTQTLNIDFDSLCGDGSSSSQANTLTITGNIGDNPDSNAIYSTMLNNKVHIKAAYVAKSGISLSDDLGEIS
jgi:hypothetical protein